MKPINFAFICELESNLMVKFEAKFEDKVEHKDFLHLHDSVWFLFFICASGWWLMACLCSMLGLRWWVEPFVKV